MEIGEIGEIEILTPYFSRAAHWELPVSFVMRTKRNKFDRIVPAGRAIMTKNDFLILFPAATQAI